MIVQIGKGTKGHQRGYTVDRERLKMKLTEMKEKHGMLEKQVAQACGICQSQISRIKNGQTKTMGSSVVTLAQVLGVSTEWLCGLVPLDEPDLFSAKNYSPEELQDALTSLASKDQTKAHAIMRAVMQAMKESQVSRHRSIHASV